MQHVLAPAALAVITTKFIDDRERGRAFGVFGSVSAAGAAVGLLLGGVLTEYANWRCTLYVNVGLALVGLLGTLALLPDDRPATRQRTDVAGTVLFTAGVFGLVFGFSNADRDGWADATTLVCLIGGAVFVASFVTVEAKVTNPALPLRVLRSRARGGALLVFFLGCIGLFAEFLFLTYYLQETLGYGP